MHLHAEHLHADDDPPEVRILVNTNVSMSRHKAAAQAVHAALAAFGIPHGRDPPGPVPGWTSADPRGAGPLRWRGRRVVRVAGSRARHAVVPPRDRATGGGREP